MSLARSLFALSLLAFFGLFLGLSACLGQDPKAKGSEPSLADNLKAPSAAEVKALDQEQRVLADRFSKLEELFIRMSEIEAASNPTRASLLQQAAQLSKQLSTLQRLQSAADLLAKGQYSQAIKEQESTKDGMTKLLELLQSENRQSRIRDERERIEALIKDIQRIERLQRSLRGRTEGGQDSESANRDQEDIKKQAQATEKGLTPEEEASKEKSDSKESDSQQKSDKKGDAKSDKESSEKSDKSDKQESEKSDSKPSNKESDQKPGDSDKKPGESDKKPSDMKSPDKDSENSSEKSKGSESKEGQPSPPKDSPESKGQESKGQESKGQNGEESSDAKPDQAQNQKPPTREETARKRLKEAQKKMSEAQEELKKEQRESATKEQQAAEEELRLAAEELERILRQLREEEVERTLADLESRLRRMLQMQTRVIDQSKLVRDTPRSNEDRTFEIQCSKLAIEERKVQMEGQKALLLLQDEGSSLAFPEAVEQVNRDVGLVIEYFSNSRIDDSCMGLQTEIIRTLEEMIESLTETQRKMEEKKKKKEANKNQKGGKGEEQEDQPLVDALAELRLIKTLQIRINTRTERLATESGKADDAKGNIEDESVLKQLQDLAERQEKIKQVTRDIVLEQTKK